MVPHIPTNIHPIIPIVPISLIIKHPINHPSHIHPPINIHHHHSLILIPIPILILILIPILILTLTLILIPYAILIVILQLPPHYLHFL